MNRRHLATAALALAGLLLGGATCALPEREVACEGGVAAELYGDGACDSCAASSCCALATRCGADPACAARAACAASCAQGDASCFVDCEESAPVEDGLYFLLVDCAGAACGETCELPERRVSTCDADAAVLGAFGGEACFACVSRNACAEASACSGNAACAARMACMRDCTASDLTPACFDQCIHENPDSGEGAASDVYIQAVETTCRDACHLGRRFECVENYNWPQPLDDPVEIRFRAHNPFNTQEPWVGLNVDVCPPLLPTCDSPLNPMPVVTDADGVAAVDVPNAGGAFETIGFDGYLYVTGDGFPDIYFYRNREEWRPRPAADNAPFPTADMVQTQLSDDHGALVGAVFDCHGLEGVYASGIVVEIDGADASTNVVYVEGFTPKASLTATSNAGRFSATRTPTGLREVRYIDAATGRVVSRHDVQLVAGKLSVVGIVPSTRP